MNEVGALFLFFCCIVAFQPMLASAVAFVRTQCSLVPTALTLPKDGAWYRGLRAPTPRGAFR